MTRRLVLACCMIACSARATAQVPGYALIVTNNRSQTTTRPDLHYADDDGVQYAALFDELLGPEHVHLLTRLDSETAALHPNVQAEAPTHANLQTEVARLAEQLENARAAGAKPIVYLVFAGHGDLDRGRGYLELADGRLTARELDSEVIARLPAERIHLILDSCNSYFLLNPRKPGGKRWASPAQAPDDLLSKYPRLGAILSTSAEAVTYEWSELQSGVFSYEVRAGLRGAADVNADGSISYAELASFIRVANQPVRNDLYRPKVFARAPRADAAGSAAPLVQWPREVGRRLLLDAASHQRLTLRDAYGVRLMDIHKEAGTAATLRLPGDLTIHVEQQLPGIERPVLVERELSLEPEQHLDDVASHPLAQLARGEPPLFSMLFAEPFGQEAFSRAQRQLRIPEEPPSGVTERDAERLRLHLALVANSAKEMRTDLAMSLLMTATIPIASLTYSVYRNSDHRGDWVDRTGFAAGAVISVVTAGLSVYFLTTHWSQEGLYEAYEREDFSTERARSRAVPRLEQAFKAKAVESRRGRDIGASFLLGGGVFGSVQGAVLMVHDLADHRALRVAGPMGLLIGLGQIIFGIYLYATESTLEGTWQAYSHDPAVEQRYAE